MCICMGIVLYLHVYISVYSNKCLVMGIILSIIGNFLSIAQKHNRLGLSVRITEGSDNGDSDML